MTCYSRGMSRSRIYTRTGDGGTTSLVDGSRASKSSARVEAYGAVDEANCWVGYALAKVHRQEGDSVLREPLVFLQHRLYNCSSNLAVPPRSALAPTEIAPGDVEYLEAVIDRLERASGPMTCFVLPGGVELASILHVARTVCRRAERRITALAAADEVDPLVLMFLNRASDLLFAAARHANATLGDGDVPWDKDLPVPP